MNIPRHFMDNWEQQFNNTIVEIDKYINKPAGEWDTVGTYYKDYMDFVSFILTTSHDPWSWCDEPFNGLKERPQDMLLLLSNFSHAHFDDGEFHFFVCDGQGEDEGKWPPFFIECYDYSENGVHNYIKKHRPWLCADSKENESLGRMLDIILKSKREKGLDTSEIEKKIEAHELNGYREVTLREWLDYWPTFEVANAILEAKRLEVDKRLKASSNSKINTKA